MTMNLRLAFGIAAIVCFVLAAFGFALAVNLFYLGWAFAVAAWLS